MSFLGFLILLVCLALIIADPYVERLTDGKVDLVTSRKHKIFLMIGVLVGFVLWFNPFVHNSDGERTYVLDPWFGSEKVVFEPGWHWGGFFYRSQSYPDVVSTVFDKETELVSVRFNDATQGEAEANIRWELPKDETSMMALHKAYRSTEALQARTLAPYSKECLGFSAQLMESETHYSGGQSKLKEDFRDQLLNGQYVLETKIEYQFDSLAKEKVKITEVNLRKDVNGVPIRIPSDVQTYGIRCAFAAVPHIDYEKIVDEKLEAKINASTRESIAKQELITAQQEAATERAKGEQLIAKTKADQEAAKLSAVIQAEREKEVAQQQAEQAKFIANKIEEEGRAEAAKNRALVAAGLTPQEKAELDKAIAIGVAAELAKIQFPNTMIISNGVSGGAINPFDVIGLESFINLTDKMQAKKN